jgi:hypothetical protein
MSGIRSTTVISFRSPARVAREAGLLLLVAMVTYVTARNSVENEWTSVAAAVVDDRWLWAPVAGAVAVAEVNRAIGPDDPVARLAARAVESAPPPGGTCVYGTEWTPDTTISILRYCFRADLLISIDRFRVADGVSVVGP